MMKRVEGWFRGRRAPAVLVMTVLMLVIFVLPILFAIGAIADHAGDVADWLRRLSLDFPPAPDWLGKLPLAGPRATAAWNAFAADPELAARLEPYSRELRRWLLGEASAAGLLMAQCLLIVILSAVLYAGGEAWGAWMRAFGRRLADARGEQAVTLAGQAIRGVALGVVVTAIIQAGLGGVGVFIADVPFAGALTGVMFILCIAQIGPILVLLGATAWLFANGHTGWGSFMLVWSFAVGLMDNFVKPVLIKRGADLPLLLIFAGVVGGLLAFGLVGIFVGPVILAVTYTLVDAWIREAPAT
jgi:predicted PurR-regulated permease PerM